MPRAGPPRPSRWRERRLKVGGAVLGNEHPETIASLSTYAGILQSLDRDGEAEPLYRQALEQRRRVLGESHPNTLLAQHSYATVLSALGGMPRLSRSAPIFTRRPAALNCLPRCRAHHVQLGTLPRAPRSL